MILDPLEICDEYFAERWDIHHRAISVSNILHEVFKKFSPEKDHLNGPAFRAWTEMIDGYYNNPNTIASEHKCMYEELRDKYPLEHHKHSMVSYFDGNDRLTTKIVVDNGKACFASKDYFTDAAIFNRLDSTENQPPKDICKISRAKIFEYVIVIPASDRDNLYAALYQKDKMHHSSIPRGEAVLFAGCAIFKDGMISSITSKSGHYKPGLIHFVYGLNHINDMELLLADARIEVILDSLNDESIIYTDPTLFLDLFWERGFNKVSSEATTVHEAEAWLDDNKKDQGIFYVQHETNPSIKWLYEIKKDRDTNKFVVKPFDQKYEEELEIKTAACAEQNSSETTTLLFPGEGRQRPHIPGEGRQRPHIHRLLFQDNDAESGGVPFLSFSSYIPINIRGQHNEQRPLRLLAPVEDDVKPALKRRKLS